MGAVQHVLPEVPLAGTTTELTGKPAFASAVADGYFSLIALDFGSQKATDDVVAKAIHLNKHCHYVRNVGYYVIGRYEASLAR